MQKKMDDDEELLSLAEKVYEQMCGYYSGVEVPGIRDESTCFGFVDQCSDRLYEARERLRSRYKIKQNDPDMEDMMNAVDALCRACSVQMFHYGARLGEEK